MLAPSSSTAASPTDAPRSERRDAPGEEVLSTLPVAGTVHNTDTLLRHNGFVGVKTGSDGMASGCFAFRAIRWIDGKRTAITGVVLGQPGHNQIAAGLRPPTPWSTASPVSHRARYGPCQIYRKEPWRQEPTPRTIQGCSRD